jgi:hypothetical protein
VSIKVRFILVHLFELLSAFSSIIAFTQHLIIIFCCFLHYRSVSLVANVRHICEGTAFENRQPNICTKVDSSTTVQLLPSAVLLQICVLVAVL